jgi:hypothetical protein
MYFLKEVWFFKSQMPYQVPTGIALCVNFFFSLLITGN